MPSSPNCKVKSATSRRNKAKAVQCASDVASSDDGEDLPPTSAAAHASGSVGPDVLAMLREEREAFLRAVKEAIDPVKTQLSEFKEALS